MDAGRQKETMNNRCGRVHQTAPGRSLLSSTACAPSLPPLAGTPGNVKVRVLRKRRQAVALKAGLKRSSQRRTGGRLGSNSKLVAAPALRAAEASRRAEAATNAM